jgi:cyclopropane fatty-acyl-phospholipid synthase-like methyltransferase
MEYCRQQGVTTVGLTLSKDQMRVGRQKGLDVRYQDYRVEDPEFYNQFDCITLQGSSEHVCSSYGMPTVRERCRSTHTDLHAVLQKYLHPHGKMLITTLVNNFHGQYTLYDYAQSYILERHYGGYYISESNLCAALEANHLRIISVQDMTQDYHWTSVVAPELFGHWHIHWHKKPVDKLLFFCKGLLTDPFLLHHWLYYACDTWMWQFGGYSETPLTDEQIQRAPAQLKYILVQKT